MENQFPSRLSEALTSFSRRSPEGKDQAVNAAYENIQSIDVLQVIQGKVRKWLSGFGGHHQHLGLLLLIPATLTGLSLTILISRVSAASRSLQPYPEAVEPVLELWCFDQPGTGAFLPWHGTGQMEHNHLCATQNKGREAKQLPKIF